MGVQAFLEQRAARPPTAVSFTAAADRGRRAGLDLQTFTRIGVARDLVVFLNAQETRSKTRVLSSPSVTASDNISAPDQVDSELQCNIAGIPRERGVGLFSNTIQNAARVVMPREVNSVGG